MQVEMMIVIKETAVAFDSNASNVRKKEGDSSGGKVRLKEVVLGGNGIGMAMLCMAHAMRAAREVVGPPPVFKSFELFIKHLDVEYGGSGTIRCKAFMIDAAKSKRISTTTSSLAEAEPEKVVECWTYGEVVKSEETPSVPRRREEA